MLTGLVLTGGLTERGPALDSSMGKNGGLKGARLRGWRGGRAADGG